MKLKVLLPFFLFFTIDNYSQNENDKIVYFDSIWKQATKENHAYYRITKELLANELYDIKDYYKSGALQMEGSSLSKGNLIRKGDFIYYYENGNKKRTEHYEKKLIGKCEEWYKNGTKKLEGEYFDTKDAFTNYKLYQYWDTNGEQTVIDGNGFYELLNNKTSESGNIKNGFRDGVWKGKNLKGEISKYIETYQNGKLVSGVSTDTENKEYKYDNLETRPEPKKGIQHFYEHIASNFVRPKEYDNVKGKIYIQFVIDKEGVLTEPKVVKSLNTVLDQEAIRVICSYQKWIPGKQRGRNVKVLYSIPVSL